MPGGDDGLEEWPERPVGVGVRGEDADVGLEVVDAGGDDVVERRAAAGGRSHAVLEAVKHLKRGSGSRRVRFPIKSLQVLSPQ